MSSLDFEFYIILILLLAMIHTLGEVIYKNGSMRLVNNKKASKVKTCSLKATTFPIAIIGISIGISLGVKVIYGIILGLNPLTVTAGLFFGSIAIFSIIFGQIFFKEQFSRYQVLGIVLIIAGIIMLV